MFCVNCGKYNPDGVTACKYCGCNKLSKELIKDPNEGKVYGVSKSTEGVLLCLFLGVIGLIIGLAIYPSGTYERESFVSAWLKTLIITSIISVVLVIVSVCITTCASMYYYS